MKSNVFFFKANLPVHCNEISRVCFLLHIFSSPHCCLIRCHTWSTLAMTMMIKVVKRVCINSMLTIMLGLPPTSGSNCNLKLNIKCHHWLIGWDIAEQNHECPQELNFLGQFQILLYEYKFVLKTLSSHKDFLAFHPAAQVAIIHSPNDMIRGQWSSDQNKPFDIEIVGQGVRRCCCRFRAEKRTCLSEI